MRPGDFFTGGLARYSDTAPLSVRNAFPLAPGPKRLDRTLVLPVILNTEPFGEPSAAADMAWAHRTPEVPIVHSTRRAVS